MSGIDTFTGRLDHVQDTGRGQSEGICPACNDDRLTLTIRDFGADCIYIRCSNGCRLRDALCAVGMTENEVGPFVTALYPAMLSEVSDAMRENEPHGSESRQWKFFCAETYSKYGVMPFDDDAFETAVGEDFAEFWRAIARRDYNDAARHGGVPPEWVAEAGGKSQ